MSSILQSDLNLFLILVHWIPGSLILGLGYRSQSAGLGSVFSIPHTTYTTERQIQGPKKSLATDSSLSTSSIPLDAGTYFQSGKVDPLTCILQSTSSRMLQLFNESISNHSLHFFSIFKQYFAHFIQFILIVLTHSPAPSISCLPYSINFLSSSFFKSIFIIISCKATCPRGYSQYRVFPGFLP